ncbi:MAG: hypothetical protein ACRC57_05695 [Sarcina sp.]
MILLRYNEVINIRKLNDFKTFIIYGLIFIFILGYSLINISKLFSESSNINLKGYIKRYEIEYIRPGRGLSYKTYTPVIEAMENGQYKEILISSAKSKIMPNHIGDKVNIIIYNNYYFIDTIFYKLVEIFNNLNLFAIAGFAFIALIIINNFRNLKAMNLRDKSIISLGLFLMAVEATIGIGILYNLKINKIAIIYSEAKFIMCSIVIILFIVSIIKVLINTIRIIKMHRNIK